MNIWKIICATLVIFITGVFTGGLLVSYTDFAAQKRRGDSENRRGGNPPFVAPRGPRDPPAIVRPLRGLNREFLQRLDAQVQLSPEQRDQIEKIISEGQTRNKELWDRIAPEMHQEIIATQKRIREVLTPEQRARFEELMKQQRPEGREDLPQPGRPRNRRPGPPPNDFSAPESPPPRPRDQL